jgi:protein phosphatase
VDEQHRGKQLRCGSCQQMFTIPTASVPAATVPAPPAATACRLDIASATHRGKVRERNEDCFLVQHLTWSDLDICHETALVVVTDGLGGHQGGDQAARLVIRTVGSAMAGVLAGALSGQMRDTSPTALGDHITRAIQNANQAVQAKAQTDPALRGMGATVAAVLVWDGLALVGHVGDCRVYHHRQAQLQQVTRDQTLVARMVELGTLTPEEAKNHPASNEITQAIGLRPHLNPAAHQMQLAEGDTLIIACDGLHSQVSDRLIADTVRKSGYSAALLANELVEKANQQGGIDNITVAAINCY